VYTKHCIDTLMPEEDPVALPPRFCRLHGSCAGLQVTHVTLLCHRRSDGTVEKYFEGTPLRRCSPAPTSGKQKRSHGSELSSPHRRVDIRCACMTLLQKQPASPRTLYGQWLRIADHSRDRHGSRRIIHGNPQTRD